MIDEIKKRLNQLTNPASGKTFEAEKRWHHISMDGDKLVAEYNRDGISPAEKRTIEGEIANSLTDLLAIDNIMIKTTSSQSQDVFKALDKQSAATPAPTAATQPAQIKAGHGTIDKKKPVPGVERIIAIGSGKGGV
nr:hypothetical protein [Bdellovibrionales bacterium]